MPKIDPQFPDLPASKWYDYGYKEGLPRLLEMFERRKVKVYFAHGLAQPLICIRLSPRKIVEARPRGFRTRTDMVRHSIP